MANFIATKSAESSYIQRLDVVSNKDQSKTASVVNGAVRLMYYESILQDTIKATYTFADTGNSVDDKTVVDGLPIVGQEKVYLKFTDNNEVTLDLVLYVNKVSPISEDTTKSMIQLELVSKEFIMNEKIRLNERFDGKISEHIKKILTDQKYLSTDKKVDIEDTSNNYNFIGNCFDLNNIQSQLKYRVEIMDIQFNSGCYSLGNTENNNIENYWLIKNNNNNGMLLIDYLTTNPNLNNLQLC